MPSISASDITQTSLMPSRPLPRGILCVRPVMRNIIVQTDVSIEDTPSAVMRLEALALKASAAQHNSRRPHITSWDAATVSYLAKVENPTAERLSYLFIQNGVGCSSHSLLGHPDPPQHVVLVGGTVLNIKCAEYLAGLGRTVELWLRSPACEATNEGIVAWVVDLFEDTPNCAVRQYDITRARTRDGKVVLETDDEGAGEMLCDAVAFDVAAPDEYPDLRVAAATAKSSRPTPRCSLLRPTVELATTAMQTGEDSDENYTTPRSEAETEREQRLQRENISMRAQLDEMSKIVKTVRLELRAVREANQLAADADFVSMVQSSPQRRHMNDYMDRARAVHWKVGKTRKFDNSFEAVSRRLTEASLSFVKNLFDVAWSHLNLLHKRCVDAEKHQAQLQAMLQESSFHQLATASIVIEDLLRCDPSGKLLVSVVDVQGRNALHVSAQYGKLDLLATVIKTLYRNAQIPDDSAVAGLEHHDDKASRPHGPNINDALTSTVNNNYTAASVRARRPSKMVLSPRRVRRSQSPLSTPAAQHHHQHTDADSFEAVASSSAGPLFDVAHWESSLTDSGNTVLHSAVISGQIAVVEATTRLALETGTFGRIIFMENGRGRDAISLAQALAFPNIASFLKQQLTSLYPQMSSRLDAGSDITPLLRAVLRADTTLHGTLCPMLMDEEHTCALHVMASKGIEAPVAMYMSIPTIPPRTPWCLVTSGRYNDNVMQAALRYPGVKRRHLVPIVNAALRDNVLHLLLTHRNHSNENCVRMLHRQVRSHDVHDYMRDEVLGGKLYGDRVTILGAADAGDTSIVAQLATHDPGLLGLELLVDEHDNTLLHIAASNGHRNFLERIFSAVDAVRISGPKKRPFLDWAMLRNHAGDTVMHCAIQSGAPGAIGVVYQALQRCGRWLNVSNTTGASGLTPLRLAQSFRDGREQSIQ